MTQFPRSRVLPDPKPFGYDLRMEILATIPLHGGASVRGLAQEFCLPRVDIRRAAVELVRQYGLRIMSDPVASDERIEIPKRKVGSVDSAALEYWERVYERKNARALTVR